MSTALLVAALVAHPMNFCGTIEARKVVKAAQAAAARHKVPVSLLVAVALNETMCRDRVAHRRGKNRAGADVGFWQIHCPGPKPQQCIDRYRPLRANAMRAAYILRLGRELCKRNPKAAWYCTRHWAGRYNPGSRRWLRSTLRVWRELTAHVPNS